MEKLKLRFLVVSLMLFGLSFLIGVDSAYAIVDPDSISIVQVGAFRNIKEANDQMYLIEYKIIYGTNPSEAPEEAFRASINDTSSLLFDNQVKNYGHGFASIYLSAAQALTWQSTAYSAWIFGSPGTFQSTTLGQNKINLSILATDWIDGTLNGTTPTVLGNRIIAIMDRVENSTGIDYVTTTNKLNSTGSTFVEDIIIGIRGFTPDIFGQASSYPPSPTPTFTRPFQSTLESNKGTRLTDSLENIGQLVTGSAGNGDTIGIVLYLLLSLAAMGTIYAYMKDGTASLVVALPLVFIGTKVGILPLALVFSIFLLVIILFGITFILGRLS